MNDRIRLRYLAMAMRMIGVFFMFGSIIALLILMDSPLVAPQTILATIFRWHPYHKAYETMILGMYAVLGIHLWNAASDPVTHRSLINFTIWVNWVHAGIMVAFASTREHEWGHLLGDVLILGLAATILMWLRRPSISLQCDASGRRK